MTLKSPLRKRSSREAPPPASERGLDRKTTHGGYGFMLYSGVMRALGMVVNPVNRMIGTKRMPYFFIFPVMALFSLFAFGPIFINVFYSISGGRSILPQNRELIGLANYETLLGCGNYMDPNSCNADLFWRGIHNSVTFVVADVGLVMVVSLVTALALNERIRGRGFFRSVFFYPVLLSAPVVALVWKWMLQREGVLNGFLGGVGVEPINWLLDTGWARLAVVVVSVWSLMGVYTLILLAGLQGIDPQLYDAARMDGSNGWQRLRDITLPLLRPTMLVAFMLAFIHSVQEFGIPFVLTGGGPGTSNVFVMQYIYNIGFATEARNFGLASTATILLAIVLIGTSYAQLRIDRKLAARS